MKPLHPSEEPKGLNLNKIKPKAKPKANETNCNAMAPPVGTTEGRGAS